MKNNDINSNEYKYDELQDYADFFGFDVREIFHFKDIKDVEATDNYLILSDLEDIYGENYKKYNEYIDIILRRDKKQGPGYNYFTKANFQHTLAIPPIYKYKQKYYRVVGIEPGTFCASDYLRILAIPDTVTEIGERAFYECDSLQAVYIGAGVNYINSEMFQCKELQRVKISKKNPYYCDVDGVVYTKYMKTLVKYPSSKKDKTFHIPDTVETIAEKAFFEACMVEEVFLGKNTKKIEKAAFAHCNNLKKIYFENIEEIGESAIWCCKSLIDVLLPTSLKSIGKTAFKYCENATIKYSGSQEMWDKVDKGESWNEETKNV